MVYPAARVLCLDAASDVLDRLLQGWAIVPSPPHPGSSTVEASPLVPVRKCLEPPLQASSLQVAAMSVLRQSRKPADSCRVAQFPCWAVAVVQPPHAPTEGDGHQQEVASGCGRRGSGHEEGHWRTTTQTVVEERSRSTELRSRLR